VPITVEANKVADLDLDNSNFSNDSEDLKIKTIYEMKEQLADHLENIVRISSGRIEAAKARLNIEQAWSDVTKNPQASSNYNYPQPQKLRQGVK